MSELAIWMLFLAAGALLVGARALGPRRPRLVTWIERASFIVMAGLFAYYLGGSL